MNDIDARLTRCFSAVFPGLTAAHIQQATADLVPNWDSIAMATLLGVIAEEFAVEIDYGEVDSFTSYTGIRDYLIRTAGR